MLTRLAAFALALSTTLTASAGGFARPPSLTRPDPRDTPVSEPAVPPIAGAPARAEVRAALAKRRAHNLASFHRYVTTGVYPHNTYRTGPLNVWRDEDGHLCAAATMLSLDGKTELVQTTGATTNNLRLLDVTTGPLLDWMLTSGLTIEEIDQIQEPGFQPDRPSPQTYAAEDAKLKRGYMATETYLKRHAAADLDEATTRLMAQPELARALVGR